MTKKFLSVVLCIAMLFMTAIPAFAADSADLPFENSHFYTYGDYEIHYRVVEHKGDFRGRIMFLHGFGQSTYAWENMAAEMSAKGYDCYMADLPNFGYSTRENADMELIDREILVEKLMLSIAPGNTWILAGHSMGGGVSINVAQNVKVKQLMLFCAAPISESMENSGLTAPSKLMISAMSFVFKYLTRIDLLMRLVVYMASVNLEFTMNYNLEGVTAPLQLDGTGEGLVTLTTHMKATDLENAASIDCPVLLVNAEKDRIISELMVEQISNAFPDAERYIVEGGGHICIEDRAEELAGVAYTFLNK